MGFRWLHVGGRLWLWGGLPFIIIRSTVIMATIVVFSSFLYLLNKWTSGCLDWPYRHIVRQHAVCKQGWSEKKHRNPTKNPARNELTVSSRSTWSCWWAWSRRSPRRPPGEHFVFNHQDLLYRILKPALMQRAGVQFDHPTGIHNHKSGYLLGNYYDVLPFKLSLFQAFWKLITNLILRDWNQLSWHWFQSRFENKRQTGCTSTPSS